MYYTDINAGAQFCKIASLIQVQIFPAFSYKYHNLNEMIDWTYRILLHNIDVCVTIRYFFNMFPKQYLQNNNQIHRVLILLFFSVLKHK